MKYTVEEIKGSYSGYWETYWHKYKTQILHREDGPARERDNGDYQYLIGGSLHRADGPASFVSGLKRYFIHDKSISVSSDEEFFQYQKLQAFQ